MLGLQTLNRGTSFCLSSPPRSKPRAKQSRTCALHRPSRAYGLRHSLRGLQKSLWLDRDCNTARRKFSGVKTRRKTTSRLIVRALRDTSSAYYKTAPLTAWSPMRSVLSLAKFFIITGSCTATAWYSHPHLLNLAAHVLHLDFKDSVTAFQTSFFSFLSLVFAIYSGNTMAFLYDRQKQMVQNLYSECMAIEELLEESVNTLGPDARDILAQIRALQGAPFSAVFHDRIKLSTGARRLKLEQKFQLLEPGVPPVKHFSIWHRVE